MNIQFQKSSWQEVEDRVSTYYSEGNILIESFFEDHVLDSQHYMILLNGNEIGQVSIYKETTIIHFHVEDAYKNLAQEIFSRAKRLEQVLQAMVPTGDEFLLSLCVDSFVRMEKQAYFAVYSDKQIEKPFQPIELRLADVEKDKELFARSKGFLDDELVKIEKGNPNLSLYIVKQHDQLIGFGVVQYSIMTNYASIGMYVCEEFREQGMARSILHHLRFIVEENGYKAVSGCWYYNHNSKKSMESAGAFTKARLLKFYF